MSTTKKLRQIGKSGIETPAIGLGCMSLTGTYGASTDEASIDVIRAALDNGITLLDSSDMYGDGKNEELIAQAVKGRRDQAVIATKFGNLGGRGGKFADGKPETVIRSCEASLKRLGVETIDLYYQHRIDPDVPVGLSEANPETIRRAHKVHPISAVQNEFSLLYRNEAEETRQTTKDLGISFVAYSPLGRSLLTAQVTDASSFGTGDARLRHPRFSGDNLARNVDLVGRLKTIAAEKHCTPGQLALAWLLAQGDDVIAIPGTKRRERLLENIGALNVELNADDLRRIAEAIPKGAAAGLRYPEGQMGSVFL